MNPISMRLLSQQLISPQFLLPEEVVRHFGAMQAQDYRMVRWAVMMRMRKPSLRLFKRAFDEGSIIRLHLLRGTWQLVAGDDYWWMLSLFGKRGESVVRGWMKANRVEISDRELYSVRDILLKTCQEKGSATKVDFAESLSLCGMAMDSHRLSYHIRLAELDGAVCSGNLSPRHATYYLTEKKVPVTAAMERDEMLMLLARKYFQSHSPATIDDYVWWTGLPVADCRRGMDLLGSELNMEQWKGSEYYMHETCRTRGVYKDKAHLLPPFDEYLIGYKSRSLAIRQEHTPHAYTNNGIFFPIIAHGGTICGNWTPWKKNLQTTFFIQPESELKLDDQWNAFCEMKSLE